MLNEYLKARRFGKDYRLHIVVNCKTKSELYLIQDSASKLSPKQEASAVRNIVGHREWRGAAIVGLR
jgi:hypothetical protein